MSSSSPVLYFKDVWKVKSEQGQKKKDTMNFHSDQLVYNPGSLVICVLVYIHYISTIREFSLTIIYYILCFNKFQYIFFKIFDNIRKYESQHTILWYFASPWLKKARFNCNCDQLHSNWKSAFIKLLLLKRYKQKQICNFFLLPTVDPSIN